MRLLLGVIRRLASGARFSQAGKTDLIVDSTEDEFTLLSTNDSFDMANPRTTLS